MLDKVKQYLKVDYDDDDTTLNLLIASAKKYVTSATGYTDVTEPRIQLLIMVLVKDWYDNGSYTTDRVSQSASYTIKSILRQLRLECDDND